ncbi:MAG: transposase [Chloroflexota bacterium]|nr:transposase [Chloroflexota bacterium]
MRMNTVWRRLLGVERAVIEAVEWDEASGTVTLAVHPRKGERGRCGVCRRRCPRYDAGEGRRRWRALDLGPTLAYLEAEAPRVRCGEHGVVVAAVPWARHEARHTRAFDDQAAWLATHCSKSAVAELLRVAWRTVGTIVTRVVADARAQVDPFADLARLGIDEVSYRRGQRYLIVVVDHDSGKLVWAAPGRDRRTLRGFFDLLGAERCAAITLVSADAAEWIADVVRERCPNAQLCTDPLSVEGPLVKSLRSVVVHRVRPRPGSRWSARKRMRGRTTLRPARARRRLTIRPEEVGQVIVGTSIA